MHTSVVRTAAIGASLVAAALYLLIGFGILDIGESADGGNPGLFEFGAMMGAVFGITAVLLWFVRSRILWVAVAVIQVIVLVGYVAFASYREPPFDLWGLVIKGAQAVILAAMVYLVVRGRETESTTTSTPTPTAPTGHAA